MKKALCIFLTLSMLMLLMVSALAEPAVFTGSARGMQGDVVVNVTIDDGKITGIEYEKYPETENIRMKIIRESDILCKIKIF